MVALVVDGIVLFLMSWLNVQARGGLLEKVTMNTVDIHLGYVCLINCIDDETNEQARNNEKVLFDKFIVGNRDSYFGQEIDENSREKH